MVDSLPGRRRVVSLELPLPIWECGSLLFLFSAREKTYSTSLLRPAPAADWTISTRLDFKSVDGTSAGLTVNGSRSHFRVIRWDLDGGSITAEHLGHLQGNPRDYGGQPPVELRIECRKGMLISSFSRDGLKYPELPLQVPAAALGDRLEFGIEAARSTWGGSSEFPSARFSYFHLNVEQLQNH